MEVGWSRMFRDTAFLCMNSTTGARNIDVDHILVLPGTSASNCIVMSDVLKLFWNEMLRQALKALLNYISFMTEHDFEGTVSGIFVPFSNLKRKCSKMAPLLIQKERYEGNWQNLFGDTCGKYLEAALEQHIGNTAVYTEDGAGRIFGSCASSLNIPLPYLKSYWNAPGARW